MNNETVFTQGTEQYQYRVVYSNGLDEPVEALIGSFEPLDIDDPDLLDELCQFVQGTLDMDCRRVLFVYLEDTVGKP